MNLASLFRHLQFYAHFAHNSVGGETFIQDHAFLGELYAAYEDAYDLLIERMIGIDEPLDLLKIHQSASSDLSVPKSFKEAFEHILSGEEDICAACEKIAKGASLGTENMLAGLADQSEMRQFKLKQRLK